MERICYRQVFFFLLLVFVLSKCGLSEKTETKSDVLTDTNFTESLPLEQITTELEDVEVNYFVPKNLYPNATLKQLKPVSGQTLEPGEIAFSFIKPQIANEKAFGVRLKIENNMHHYFYKPDEKVVLPQGSFLCVAFLCDKNGFSIKKDSSYCVTKLLVGKGNQEPIDLTQPMVCLNIPDYKEENAVFIDFMLLNFDLSNDGNSIRLSIDNKIELFMKEWKPVKVSGLQPGLHDVVIELINPNENLLDSIYATDHQMLEIPYNNLNQRVGY